MLIMSLICKRFEKGEPPYTALQLKLTTNIPIRITQDILYELIDMNFVSEISGDEKGEVSVYQPAQDISRLSVGRLIDKYETNGKWELKLNMSEMNHDKWNKIIAEHSAYLRKQRTILLKDL